MLLKRNYGAKLLAKQKLQKLKLMAPKKQKLKAKKKLLLLLLQQKLKLQLQLKLLTAKLLLLQKLPNDSDDYHTPGACGFA
ncbi:MAG: hypothetical protein NTX25_03205 [Proteobacteria bacterium]|nr:hypothetical protein [Pseudomonadota bacterium]